MSAMKPWEIGGVSQLPFYPRFGPSIKLRFIFKPCRAFSDKPSFRDTLSASDNVYRTLLRHTSSAHLFRKSSSRNLMRYKYTLHNAQISIYLDV